MINLITSTLQPDSWDSVGGAGSIDGEPSRMALVVMQTPEMQDEVAKLLTMLRRHRYEALHGNRPWERSSGVKTRPAAAVTLRDDVNEPSRLSDYPNAEPGELGALQARRDPDRGTWRWRRIAPSGAQEEISVRLTLGRLQCELPKYILRTDGDAAAVAWPGLRLVELGNYAEVLRRAVDVRLPWLPHRSNRELARLFDVSEVNQEEGHGSANTSQADAVWLRMVPAAARSRRQLVFVDCLCA